MSRTLAMKIRRITTPLALALLACLAPLPAAASCQLTGGAASCNCIAASGPLSFGNYDSTSPVPPTNFASISVDCSTAVLPGHSGSITVSFTIAINAGNGSGGSFLPRAMSSGNNRLSYNIITKGNIWGDGSPGTTTVSNSGTASGSISLDVDITETPEGQIPIHQAVPAGHYSDMLTITVSY